MNEKAKGTKRQRKRGREGREGEKERKEGVQDGTWMQLPQGRNYKAWLHCVGDHSIVT